jgi:hypothetical protein
VPSASIGFAKYANEIEPEILVALGIPDTYDDLVPLSMFTALPSMQAGTYINPTLCSVIHRQQLATCTMALGIASYAMDTLKSIVQYDNPAIKVHARFGSLMMEAAQVAVHDLSSMTFVYRLDLADKEEVFDHVYEKVDETKVASEADILLDPVDNKKKQSLQHAIEGGGGFTVMRPGMIHYQEKLIIPIRSQG